MFSDGIFTPFLLRPPVRTWNFRPGKMVNPEGVKAVAVNAVGVNAVGVNAVEMNAVVVNVVGVHVVGGWTLL